MTSSQNLTGGFIGGAVGILASWYLGPMALLFGVLLGVAVGWWNEDIIRLPSAKHNAPRKTATGFVETIDSIASTFARFCGMPANMFRWIVGTVVAVTAAPARFTRWLALHQTNRVIVINLMIIPIFVLGIPLAIWFLEPYIGIHNREPLALLGLIIAVSGTALYQMRCKVGKNHELDELGQFYREWEVISHYGSIGFFIYTITMHIRYMIGFVVFCAVAVPWLFTIAVVGIVVAYPLFGGIIVAQWFYKVVSRSGDWLCLGATIVVTVLSWLAYHESFADPRILWATALGAGIVSGGVTEMVRQFMLVFYEHTAIGREIAMGNIWNLVDNNEDIDKGYVGVIGFRLAGMWFRQNRPARIFRTICFGIAVAPAVRLQS